MPRPFPPGNKTYLQRIEPTIYAFTLGQRWISDTESELGLGTVVALDARMITLLFPATGENRLYARNDSPITRVMFNLAIPSAATRDGSCRWKR